MIMTTTYPDASDGLLDEIFLTPVRHVDLVHVKQFAEKKKEDSDEHEGGGNPEGQGVALVHPEAGHTGPNDNDNNFYEWCLLNDVSDLSWGVTSMEMKLPRFTAQ